MTRHLGRLAAALLIALAFTPLTAHAQLSNASVVTICGTPNVTYAAGTTKAITQGTDGKLCINATVSANVTPLAVATTEKGGTITAGGTAQAAIALNASRKGWCVQNDPAATETLNVRPNGTASATSGTALQPGQQACNLPGLIDTAAISVFAATTGHRWFGSEMQ